MNTLELYGAIIKTFAEKAMKTEDIIQWLAPSAVELKNIPVPKDYVYYQIEEKCVILRTRNPALGILWWLKPEPGEEVMELHMKPIERTVRFKEWEAGAGLGIAEQTHSLGDLQHLYQFESPAGYKIEVVVNEIMFAHGESPGTEGLVGKIGELMIKKSPGKAQELLHPDREALVRCGRRLAVVLSITHVSEDTLRSAIDGIVDDPTMWSRYQNGALTREDLVNLLLARMQSFLCQTAGVKEPTRPWDDPALSRRSTPPWCPSNRISAESFKEEDTVNIPASTMRILLISIGILGIRMTSIAASPNSTGGLQIVQSLFRDHQPYSMPAKELDFGNKETLSAYFDKELTELFLRDARCAGIQQGRCVIDFDPVYGGQDGVPENSHMLEIHACASSPIQYCVTTGSKAQIRFTVRKTSSGWRISDIEQFDGKWHSLKSLLNSVDWKSLEIPPKDVGEK